MPTRSSLDWWPVVDLQQRRKSSEGEGIERRDRPRFELGVEFDLVDDFSVLDQKQFALVGTGEQPFVGHPAVRGEVVLFLFQTLRCFQRSFIVPEHSEQTIADRAYLRVVLRIERHLECSEGR